MRILKCAIAALALAMICPHASGQAYNVFQPGCALGGTWNSQSVSFASPGCFSGNLPQANQTSIASPSFLANNSGSSAPAAAVNPLAAATMMSATLAVDVVSTTNITLSGIQTIDGVTLSSGQFVLVQGQTTTSQNGIYVVATGAWSRAANFPSGYVIAQNCEIVIWVRLGTVNAGSGWYIPTGSAITIGTTGFTPSAINTNATATRKGTVLFEGGAGSAVGLGGTSPAAGDCAGFPTAGTAIVDIGTDASGNAGNCALTNANSGHLIIDANGFPAPTSSAGTINPNSTDHWGFITGLSGATSVTVTFAATFTATPACTANDNQAATPVYISAISATAVTFSFSSLTGTLYYTCFGLN